MSRSIRFLAVLLAAAVVAVPARAQEDREARSESEDVDVEREVVVERDGEVYRFRVPRAALRRFDADGGTRTDTVIDGRRIVRFKAPGGEVEVLEFEATGPEGMRFRRHARHEVERLRAMSPDHAEHGGEPLGFQRFREEHRLHEGVSEETRREMMELERRAHTLASEARRADAAARQGLERQLGDVLGALFDARGRMREEQAAHLEARAAELSREAERLREEVRGRDRERRALIEARQRELLGDDGAGW